MKTLRELLAEQGNVSSEGISHMLQMEQDEEDGWVDGEADWDDEE